MTSRTRKITAANLSLPANTEREADAMMVAIHETLRILGMSNDVYIRKPPTKEFCTVDEFGRAGCWKVFARFQAASPLYAEPRRIMMDSATYEEPVPQETVQSGGDDATAPDAKGFGFLSNHRAGLAALFVLTEQAGGKLRMRSGDAMQLASGNEDVGLLRYVTDETTGDIVFMTRPA